MERAAGDDAEEVTVRSFLCSFVIASLIVACSSSSSATSNWTASSTTNECDCGAASKPGTEFVDACSATSANTTCCATTNDPQNKGASCIRRSFACITLGTNPAGGACCFDPTTNARACTNPASSCPQGTTSIDECSASALTCADLFPNEAATPVSSCSD